MVATFTLALAFGPYTLIPVSQTIGLGQWVSGSLESLYYDDNDAEVIRKYVYIAYEMPIIRLSNEFKSPTLAPTSLSYEVKLTECTHGAFEVRMQVLDRVTYTWETVLSAPLQDGKTYRGTVSKDPVRYLYYGGTVTARTEIWPHGPSAATRPVVSFEYVNVIVGD